MAEQEEFHVYSEENAIRYPEKYHTMDQSAEQFIDVGSSYISPRDLPFVELTSIKYNPVIRWLDWFI